MSISQTQVYNITYTDISSLITSPQTLEDDLNNINYVINIIKLKDRIFHSHNNTHEINGTDEIFHDTLFSVNPNIHIDWTVIDTPMYGWGYGYGSGATYFDVFGSLPGDSYGYGWSDENGALEWENLHSNSYAYGYGFEYYSGRSLTTTGSVFASNAIFSGLVSADKIRIGKNHSYFDGNLTLEADTVLNGTLEVSGATNLNTLNILGEMRIISAFTVNGASVFNSKAIFDELSVTSGDVSFYNIFSDNITCDAITSNSESFFKGLSIFELGAEFNNHIFDVIRNKETFITLSESSEKIKLLNLENIFDYSVASQASTKGYVDHIYDDSIQYTDNKFLILNNFHKTFYLNENQTIGIYPPTTDLSISGSINVVDSADLFSFKSIVGVPNSSFLPQNRSFIINNLNLNINLSISQNFQIEHAVWLLNYSGTRLLKICSEITNHTASAIINSVNIYSVDFEDKSIDLTDRIEYCVSISVTSQSDVIFSMNYGDIVSMSYWENNTNIVSYANTFVEEYKFENGTESFPYLISSLDDLVRVSQTAPLSAGKFYRLINDIDASETVNWNNGAGFTPIGNNTNGWVSNYFRGVFDGNGYKITGIVVKSQNLASVFGVVGNGGVVRNLGVDGCFISGGISSAGIIAWNYGTIENCFANGIVDHYTIIIGSSTVYRSIGGLVANNYGYIRRCYTDCIVGSYDFQDRDSFCSTGGLVGVNEKGGLIEDCFSLGDVIGRGKYSGIGGRGGIGGLVGFGYGSIQKCYSACHITVPSTDLSNPVGGLIGVGLSKGSVIISNCYWDTQVSTLSTSDGGVGKTISQMGVQSTFVGWNFATVWGISSVVNNGYPYLHAPLKNNNNNIQYITKTENFTDFNDDNLGISSPIKTRFYSNEVSLNNSENKKLINTSSNSVKLYSPDEQTFPKVETSNNAILAGDKLEYFTLPTIVDDLDIPSKKYVDDTIDANSSYSWRYLSNSAYYQNTHYGDYYFTVIEPLDVLESGIPVRIKLVGDSDLIYAVVDKYVDLPASENYTYGWGYGYGEGGDYFDVFSTSGDSYGYGVSDLNGVDAWPSEEWGSVESIRNWYAVDMSTSGQYQTAVVYGGQIYRSENYGVDWTAVESNRNWRSVAMSSDGKYQTTINNNGYIYRSELYGATGSWTQVASSKSWILLNMSLDGKYQIGITGAFNGGEIYLSANHGVNWSLISSVGTKSWKSVSISDDGQYQTAVATYYIYKSSNYGVNWTQITGLEFKYWNKVVMSSDGRYQTAVHLGATSDIHYIDRSTDYGETWEECTSSGSRHWVTVAMSTDGLYQTACSQEGYLYKSDDYGYSWAEITLLGMKNWKGVVLSSTGQYQTAYVTNGYIYKSIDFGASWAQEATSQNWYDLKISSDGQYRTGCAYGGYLYKVNYTTSNWETYNTNRYSLGYGYERLGIYRVYLLANKKINASIEAIEYGNERLVRQLDFNLHGNYNANTNYYILRDFAKQYFRWNMATSYCVGFKTKHMVDDSVDQPIVLMRKSNFVIDGLIARWAFNEGAGIIAYDLIGGNNGTLEGGATWGERGGSNCLSLSVDGTVIVENTDVIGRMYQMTVSLWVKYNTIESAFYGLFSKFEYANSVSVGYSLSASINSPSGVRYEFSYYYPNSNDNFIITFSSDLIVSIGEWEYVCFVIDCSKTNNEKFKFYRNGVELFSVPIQSSIEFIESNSVALSFGSRYFIHQTDFLNGDLDDIRVYDVALSEDEVLSLYNDGNGVESDGRFITSNFSKTYSDWSTSYGGNLDYPISKLNYGDELEISVINSSTSARDAEDLSISMISILQEDIVDSGVIYVPSAPLLLTPEDLSEYLGPNFMTVNFSWSASVGTAPLLYDLYCSSSGDEQPQLIFENINNTFLTHTFANGYSGAYSWYVVAKNYNGENSSLTRSFSLSGMPPNAPVKISPDSTTYYRRGGAVVFQWSPILSESAVTVTFYYTLDNVTYNKVLDLDQNNSTHTEWFLTGGQYKVWLVLENEYGTRNNEANNYYLHICRDIVLVDINDANNNGGESYSQALSIESGDFPVYSLTSSPTWLSINSEGVISGTAPRVGAETVYSVTSRAENMNGYDEVSWAITVNDIAPVLDAISDQIISDRASFYEIATISNGAIVNDWSLLNINTIEDQFVYPGYNFSYQATATVADTEWVLSSGVRDGQPMDMDIDGSTGVITWENTSAGAGDYNIIVSATYFIYSASYVFSTTFNLMCAVFPPILNDIADITIHSDDLLDIELCDNTNFPVASVESNIAGITFSDLGVAPIHIKWDAPILGEYEVTITATNTVTPPILSSSVTFHLSVILPLPTIGTVLIQGGTSHTSSLSVTAYVSYTNSPTLIEYGLTEPDPDVGWSYDWTAVISGGSVSGLAITLPFGSYSDFIRTVYFRVKNTTGYSVAWASDSISLNIPVISQFSINGGSASTASLSVSLNSVCTYNPTHYMASAYSDFSGAGWSTYSIAPGFLLTSEYGDKTVYFKVKNAVGESAVVSDTINYVAPTPVPVISSFSINGGDASTTNRTVSLTYSCTNSPTEYIVSGVSSNFSGAVWSAYSSAVNFNLVGATGAVNNVYFKVRNSGGESSYASDTITLSLPALQTPVIVSLLDPWLMLYGAIGNTHSITLSNVFIPTGVAAGGYTEINSSLYWVQGYFEGNAWLLRAVQSLQGVFWLNVTVTNYFNDGRSSSASKTIQVVVS